METLRVAEIAAQLGACAARELESQTLEIKSWCKDERELSQKIAEAAVCLSNTEGGLLIVGVEERGGSGAIRPCPYQSVSADWVRSRIRELTKPVVKCGVHKLGELVPTLADSRMGELFVIEIPKTSQPGGHRTIGGISYRRSDKECFPDSIAAGDDFSDCLIENVSTEAFDYKTLSEAGRNREDALAGSRYLGHDAIDHLLQANLLRYLHDIPENESDHRVPTIAALLLFGSEAQIKVALPAAHTVVTSETASSISMSSTRWLNIIESTTKYLALIQKELRQLEYAVPIEIISELLMNAYLHRCYRTPGPVRISVRKDEIEIKNPGGLLGSLTVDTLLQSTPFYRNLLLADAARLFGYCDKAGLGIKKVYRYSILNGFDFPLFEATQDSFSAVVRTRPDVPFSRFVRDYAGGADLELPDLIILRALRTRGRLTAEQLAGYAQRSEAYMAKVLVNLVNKNILAEHELTFCLSEQVKSRIAQYDESGQMKLLL
ncbi:ATP-binding protein [Candidatus Binatus sp.]|uniref:ATP-binding protein n=1 Tax=Candidatus Binatus sp. TaxID=2811406 RepID=UPI003C76B2D1